MRNTLFPYHENVSYRFAPWAMFTEPALARVGDDRGAGRVSNTATLSISTGIRSRVWTARFWTKKPPGW